jgi:hypothetical protein
MSTVWLDQELCESGDLPDVCLKCGRSTSNRVTKTFSWVPGWVYILILVNLIVLLIVAMILRKSVTAHVPLCQDHKNHWLYRTLGIVLGLVAAIGWVIAAIVIMGSLPPGSDLTGLVAMSMLGALLGWLIMAAVVSATAIRAVEISDRRGLKLTGVCREFVDAYHDFEEGFEEVRRPRRVRPDAEERWSERRRDRPEERDRYRGEDEGDRGRYRDEGNEDRPRRPKRDRSGDDY